ncbi:hypothetical protein DFR70_104435 [Nocardia tenerifensis]|uniref:Uncharacterized protein n=1 Tax=Nocardia tenerifensis TaxID=228006 RepID=A0A318K270_9NOCA|nr:hypothetical protein [Nocardia tenerifensis]PXX65371.1 hypothetical protein DFR70_104435 [Nocardia tenerifensis]
MSRTMLKVLVAVAISLTAGAGAANAATNPGGIPLEPATADPIGVSPGSSDAASLACLVQSISYGAKYCL